MPRKKAKPKSNEYDIRAAVIRKLIAEGFPRDRIRIEIPLDMASSEGRADILLLPDHGIFCVELKSGKDKWCEIAIKEQTRNYRRAFDGCTVIVDISHRREKMQETVFDNGGRGYSLISNWRSVHQAYCHDTQKIGPISYHQDNAALVAEPNLLQEIYARRSYVTSVYDMARVLWLSETKERFGSKISKSRWLQIVREESTLKDVRPLVIEALRNRPANAWEKTFWARYDAPGAG